MMARLFLLIGFAFLAGCVGQGQGEEGGPCGPSGQCFEGLTCLSDLCVDAEPGAQETPRLGLICAVADECVYLDSTIGETLTWQGCSAGQMGESCIGEVEKKSHPDAVTYCEGLTWGGFDDWVLPNIDELRSLIRGCAKNEYGSSECSVAHQCSYSTNNANTCGDDYCHGFVSQGGGPGSDGCYWPADLPGTCSGLWSSSLRSSSNAYVVIFFEALVTFDTLLFNGGEVRCVRSRP